MPQRKRGQLPIKKGANCLLPQEGGELSSLHEERDLVDPRNKFSNVFYIIEKISICRYLK
jgi:hypothetical protein